MLVKFDEWIKRPHSNNDIGIALDDFKIMWCDPIHSSLRQALIVWSYNGTWKFDAYPNTSMGEFNYNLLMTNYLEFLNTSQLHQ